MAHDAIVLFRVDALAEIERDPESGKKIADAIRQHTLVARHDGVHDVAIGNHANAIQIVSNQHADYAQVIIAGGGYASLVSSRYHGNVRHHDNADQLALLQESIDVLLPANEEAPFRCPYKGCSTPFSVQRASFGFNPDTFTCESGHEFAAFNDDNA